MAATPRPVARSDRPCRRFREAPRWIAAAKQERVSKPELRGCLAPSRSGSCFLNRRCDAGSNQQDDPGENEKDEGRPEADGEIGAIADGTDDLRRKRVAETMNDEEI